MVQDESIRYKCEFVNHYISNNLSLYILKKLKKHQKNTKQIKSIQLSKNVRNEESVKANEDFKMTQSQHQVAYQLVKEHNSLTHHHPAHNHAVQHRLLGKYPMQRYRRLSLTQCFQLCPLCCHRIARMSLLQTTSTKNNCYILNLNLKRIRK